MARLWVMPPFITHGAAIWSDTTLGFKDQN